MMISAANFTGLVIPSIISKVARPLMLRTDRFFEKRDIGISAGKVREKAQCAANVADEPMTK